MFPKSWFRPEKDGGNILIGLDLQNKVFDWVSGGHSCKENVHRYAENLLWIGQANLDKSDFSVRLFVLSIIT